MNQPIVIIGIGELGGVFAKAFLHAGYPVYPVTRGMDISQAANQTPDPQLVLVAVGEKDFGAVMATIPSPWRSCVGLLQNELLPGDWKPYPIAEPTVISVWFEKKKGLDTSVLIPSRVYGPWARLVADALQGIDIACDVLTTDKDLLYELVRKNVFVLTINIAGLVLAEGTTTATLWEQHQELAVAVANEIIDVQQFLTGEVLDRRRLLDGLIEGINGDRSHKCKGRSAPGRLERTVAAADSAGLEISRVRKIKANIG
jgi:ketopantoate reductase